MKFVTQYTAALLSLQGQKSYRYDSQEQNYIKSNWIAIEFELRWKTR